jgi:hypothetical protein
MQGNLSISPVNGDHVIFNFVDRTIELPDPHPQYLYADHEILFKAMPTLRFRPVNDAYCKSYVEQDCKTTEALYHAAQQLDEWDDEVEDDEICNPAEGQEGENHSGQGNSMDEGRRKRPSYP